MSKGSVGIKIGDNVKGTRLKNVTFGPGFETPIEVGENSDVTLENVAFELGEPTPLKKEKRKGWSRLLEMNWPWRRL